MAEVESLGKQLRPELTVSNHRNEPAEGFTYYSWANPQCCSECGEVIQEYEYYFFAKRSLSEQRQVVQSYFCCLKDYQRLAP